MSDGTALFLMGMVAGMYAYQTFELIRDWWIDRRKAGPR